MLQSQIQDDKKTLLISIITALRYWIKFLLKKWIYLLFFGIIGFGLGVLYAWLKTPIYTAEMTFSSEADGQSKMGGYAGLAAQFGFDIGTGGNTFEGDNLVEFFKSKSLIEATLYSTASFKTGSYTLAEYYLRCRYKPEKWKTDTVFSKLSFTQNLQTPNRNRDSIIKKITEQILKQNLVVDKRDKKLVFIDAKFSDIDETFAKTFLETLTANAIKYYVEYKSKKAKANVDLLERQVDSISRVLTGNIVQVAVSNDLNVNPVKQASRTTYQRKQVDVQASGAAYSELLKQLALAKINLSKETPLIQIIDDAKYPLLKKKPGRLLTGIIGGIIFGFLGLLFLVSKNIFNQTFNSISLKNNAA